MPLADYAHWNEEAPQVWWQEEGRHMESDGEAAREEQYDADEAFFDDHADDSTEDLKAMLADEAYCARWPRAAKCIRWILKDRGE